MRRSVLVLASALVASTLAFTSASAFTPVGIAYPGDNGGGNFYTTRSRYEVGQVVELAANFASDQSGKTVTYYKEDPAGSNDYATIGTRTANSNGNAYLKDYQVNAKHKVYAQTSAGKRTELHTLDPTPPDPGTVIRTTPRSRARWPRLRRVRERRHDPARRELPQRLVPGQVLRRGSGRHVESHRHRAEQHLWKRLLQELRGGRHGEGVCPQERERADRGRHAGSVGQADLEHPA